MDTNPNGIGGSAGYGADAQDGFYRTRDDLVGGTDTAYNDAADFDQDDVNIIDMRADDDTRFSGTFSQSALAGGSDYSLPETKIYGS